MINKLLFYSFVIFFTIVFSNIKGQSTGSDYFVENSLANYNLKGSIKEITVKFVRNYPADIPLEKKIEYELKNFWAVSKVPLGKYIFNRQGLVQEKYYRYKDEIPGFPFNDSWNIRWIIKFDEKDYRNKTKLYDRQDELFMFPLLDPYEIEIDQIQFKYIYKNKSDESKQFKFFEYISNENVRITDELEKDGDGNIEIRKTYHYDKNDRIVRQDMTFMEEVPEARRLFLDVMLKPSYFILSINHAGYYEYAYTDEGKLSMTKLVIDGEILLQEDYFYEEVSWRPYKLERYVISKITSGYQYSDYSTEWYNEFGDITKAENYDQEKTLIRTQHYDYEYDVQNNWTVCEMYLEGSPKRSEKPTIVAYRDIKYYKR